jgi:sec-independent protein translocase protein TatA
MSVLAWPGRAPARFRRTRYLAAFFVTLCKGETMSPLFAFGVPGPMELVIIMAIMLLLFGHRLPSVMRSLGRGVVEFKKGVQGVEDEFEEATRSLDRDPKKGDA